MPFLEEMGWLMERDGVASRATNLLLSSQPDVPEGEGPYLSIVESGGTSPERTHNARTQANPTLASYLRPGAQLIGRAKNYALAREITRKAMKSVSSVHNQILAAVASRIVTSLTRSGTTVTATLTNHGFWEGQRITIAGAAQSEYNGTFEVWLQPGNLNRFYFTVSGAPVTPATGSLTAAAPGTFYLEIAPSQSNVINMTPDGNGLARAGFNVIGSRRLP